MRNRIVKIHKLGPIVLLGFFLACGAGPYQLFLDQISNHLVLVSRPSSIISVDQQMF